MAKTKKIRAIFSGKVKTNLLNRREDKIRNPAVIPTILPYIFFPIYETDKITEKAMNGCKIRASRK